MIEQSPNKANEDMRGNMANENLNSPLSAAVNQAKIKMTSSLYFKFKLVIKLEKK